MGNPSLPTAVEIRCESCGSAFEATEVAPQVCCPFCRHVQQLDADLLARLEHYEGQFKEQIDAIAVERKQTARFDAWYGRMRKGTPASVVAVTVLFMLGPILLGFVMWGLVSLFGEETVGRLMPLVPIPLMLIVFATLAGWTGWMYSGRRRKRSVAALESAALACPGCGAVSRIEPGVRATSCDFCGASLLPTEPLMSRSLAAAQQAKFTARQERYQAEREGIAKALSYSLQGAVHWMVLGPFMLMTCGGAVAFSFEMAVGHEPFHPGIFLIWAMGFGCIAAGVGITLYQRGMRRRWRAALAAVARGSGGEILSGLGGLIGWLDRYWAGPYDLRFIYAGPYAHGATLSVDGYAGLLWIDPTAASQHHQARAHLFVAAWIPGVADEEERDRPVAADDLLAQLRREYDVELQQGGLFVPLDPMDIKQLRKNPTQATQLAPVFPRLAALANALGASPVGADRPLRTRTR